MKKIGLLGGMGPEASLEYYRQLISLAKENKPEERYPEIVIYNLNFEDFCKPVSRGEDEEVFNLLRNKLNALKKAGADFAMMASNTPHLYYDRLEDEVSIPLLSIVDATAERAKERRLEKVALLGTEFTMNADFYPSTFEESGIDLVVPKGEHRSVVHDKIMNELVNGEFRDSTKEKLIEIIGGLRRNQGIDGVVLGCTELPLILSEEELGVSVLDTTRIHVEAGFELSRE